MPALRNSRRETFAQLVATRGGEQGYGVDRAYREAGYLAGAAAAQRLRGLPEIERRIAEIAGSATTPAVSVDKVLARWWEIATADPNALVQVRRGCCRHCHGEGFAHQWRDPEEFAQALAAAERAKARQLPGDDGGYGFDSRRDPQPDCPNCGGEGLELVHVADTRHLSGAAAALYAGAKATKDGVEIRMRDQAAALDRIARHLGMFGGKEDNAIGVTVHLSGADSAL